METCSNTTKHVIKRGERGRKRPSVLSENVAFPEHLEDSEPPINPNSVQYTHNGDVYSPCSRTKKTLPPGAYTITFNDRGIHFVKKNIIIDNAIDIRSDMITDFFKEIQRFWDNAESFKKYGFTQKRGYILYGVPGGGKTVLVNQIVEKTIQMGGIVFFSYCPDYIVQGLKLFREVEPTRKILVVFEDIDAIIDRYGDSSLLSYLDGDDGVNYAINIATTNYLDRLPKRFRNRPRRFDRMIKIGYPDANIRRTYFEVKLQIEKDEIDKWVNATKDFTFAAMADLVISVKCLLNDFDESVTALRTMLEASSKSYEVEMKEESGSSVGFGNY